MGIDVSIKKNYGDFKLDVSFESSSRRIGILGASGCGKSLTLKSIAGLIRPDEGRITVENRVLFDKDLRIDIKPGKRRTGYLFQEYALFPNMTVEENIAAALHGRKSSKGSGNRAGNAKNAEHIKILTTEEILKNFGLWGIRHHRPHELSGGQQQRTALARMLATDPSLLLLDEPFSAMDSFLREGLRLELIRILDMYNKTVILVSHDRDEIYQMCDHLVLMDNGKVIGTGDIHELFRNPKTVAAARLTGCKNISRIEKMTEHRVKALDWDGIELVTGAKVIDKIKYIGIRAHDFIPGEHGVNAISCEHAAVSGLPFEWYITLENGLWWKLGKELYDIYDEGMLPQNISIDPDRILLLAE